MLKAPIPVNESERQRALDSYEVLDTERELAFDDITRIATAICGTPIAAVSLIDNDRQWFKSTVGLDATETPRDISFCGHAIHHSNIFQVENALDDERFADNPLVAGELNLRFYAGAPLVTSDGFAIGSLCVIDRVPRTLTAQQREGLESLARQVMAQLELRRKNKELTLAKEKLEDSARTIADQQSKLVNSAKMTALGTMAGGVAHEINNPLAIITGRTHLLREQLQSEACDISKAVESVEKIEKTALRISKIVKGLLAVSHEENGAGDPLVDYQVEDVVQEALSLAIEKLKKAGISVEVTPIRSGLAVRCRPVQVIQSMLNLIGNAHDALEACAERHIRIEALEDDSSVMIRVSDSGVGIPVELRARIMEPFFSTKPVGKGTGLGLSVSRGLIEKQSGQLYLDEGAALTTFVIKLGKAVAQSAVRAA